MFGIFQYYGDKSYDPWVRNRNTYVASSLNLKWCHNVMQKNKMFSHHRSSAVHALTDNILGLPLSNWSGMCIYPFFFLKMILIFLLWYLTGLISWLIYLLCLMYLFYYFVISFLGGYNHGPCGGGVGFVTLCLLL